MSLCVVDEAHHSISSSYRKLLALGWRSRLGLTGTPWRMSDYEGFEDVWDTLIQGPDYGELRSLGWLADFRVVEPTVECPGCGHRQHPALRCCERCGLRLWWGCGADTAGERGCGRDRFWHHFTSDIATLQADIVRHCSDCRDVAHLVETVGSGQLCLPGIQ